ncbi:MAG: DUF1232 domain-containing protein [Bacteroides sp.]|nr:DUF1232 domain-containing protein [Bacteroides sp.]
MAFNKKYFIEHLSKYEDYYNPDKLMEKIKKYGRIAGIKVVYAVLILYYASMDKNIPTKDRLMIFAALGYFILPLDFIPDTLPLGFTDDMAALTFVLKTIWSNLTPNVFAKARKKLEEWFGPVTDEEIYIPGIS